MNKPNFFILGAPKCGTTSLAGWLSERPNIFMCPTLRVLTGVEIVKDFEKNW